MTWPILIALAGVMGAAGVVLAAAGAHSRPDAGLDNASQMLLVHALAVIAIGAAAGQGLLVRPLARRGRVAGIAGDRPGPAAAQRLAVEVDMAGIGRVAV
ncbi:MAG: hypothetical protein F9K38_16725, partial [Pseudorhodoplanes sp.]